MRYFLIVLLYILTFSNLYAKTFNELITKIANSTPTMQYLFWVAKDENSKNIPYLTRNKNDGSFSVWHFTPDKKWQPIHNAGAFDGFDKAEKTLENVSFEPSTGVLTIGKSILPENNAPDENKPKLPEGVTLKSNDIQNGAFLDEKYSSSVSPSLSWDVSGDIKNKNIIKSYAVSLKDLDVDTYHWHIINIPSSVESLPQGPLSNYNNSRNIVNDFGSPSYTGPFPPTGETHNYKFSVYGFVTSSIRGAQDYKNAIYKSSITVKYKGK